MGRVSIKEERHKKLTQIIEEDPFLTDEELAENFGVSVATIRFDRAALGILEYRERIKNVAYKKKNGFNAEEGSAFKMVDCTPMSGGIFTFKTDKSMAFAGSDIVRGCYIYSFAETLAIKVIDKTAAIVDVANIKYKSPVVCGSKLLARSQVIRIRNDEYIVWVKIDFRDEEVFRCKFMLKALDEKTGRNDHENCR